MQVSQDAQSQLEIAPWLEKWLSSCSVAPDLAKLRTAKVDPGAVSIRWGGNFGPLSLLIQLMTHASLAGERARGLHQGNVMQPVELSDPCGPPQSRSICFRDLIPFFWEKKKHPDASLLGVAAASCYAEPSTALLQDGGKQDGNCGSEEQG